MEIQAALERAQAMACQLKYDTVHAGDADGHPGIIVARVPAACYHLNPEDPKFQQGAVCVFITDEMPQELFDLRLQQAISTIEKNFVSVYPNELQERAALIRKGAH